MTLLLKLEYIYKAKTILVSQMAISLQICVFMGGGGVCKVTITHQEIRKTIIFKTVGKVYTGQRAMEALETTMLQCFCNSRENKQTSPK